MSFSWADVPAVGIALDISGAAMLAWTLSRNTAERITQTVPISTRGYGMPRLAKQMAFSAAEARCGMAFLVAGFLCQSTAYFFPAAGASLTTWSERAVALGLMAATGALGVLAYAVIVRRVGGRIWANAELRDSLERRA